MKDHIYKEGKTKVNEETWYLGYTYLYQNVFKVHGKNCDSIREYTLDINYHNNLNNTIQLHRNYSDIINGDILQTVPFKKGPSGKITNLPTEYCLFATKQELENWKHFVFNNKIPLFTSIVLVISLNNRVKDIIPWIVDKLYTDDLLYLLLGITEEELNFIDYTIHKYERKSPWFRRYSCGLSGATTEEIMDYLHYLC